MSDIPQTVLEHAVDLALASALQGVCNRDTTIAAINKLYRLDGKIEPPKRENYFFFEDEAQAHEACVLALDIWANPKTSKPSLKNEGSRIRAAVIDLYERINNGHKPSDQVSKTHRDKLCSAISFGCLDARLMAINTIVKDYLNKPEDVANIQTYMDCVRECGPFFTFSDFCFVVDRPEKFNLVGGVYHPVPAKRIVHEYQKWMA